MIPRLITARLTLDAFTLDDVPAVVELAGHPDIFATTLLIPHPYTPADGQRWMTGHLPEFLKGENVEFAVRQEGRLIGAVGLQVNRKHDQAQLGYWIGKPHWNNGFATEATRAAVAFAFPHFHLEKIIAKHHAENPASGRVMEKIGLTREGFHPCGVKKGERYIDYYSYGLTRANAAALLNEQGREGLAE